MNTSQLKTYADVEELKLCNQQYLLVTKNLHDCLRQLSQTSTLGNGAFATVWVDAICINQDHPEECASQVSMMSDIYLKAENVIIWLGELEESTPLAWDLMRKLVSLSQNERELIELGSFRTGRSVPSPLGHLHTPAHWQAVVELLERTWFTRSWVVQEFVLAREITVLCGSLTLDWDHIVAISGYLATRASNNLLNSSVCADLNLESSSYKTPAKLSAVKIDFLTKHPEALLRSLIRCRDYDCLKPEDRIYSLLGIHQAIHGPLSPQDKLYPNYSLHGPEVSRVYVDAAVQLLKQGSDLTVLTVVEGQDFQNFKDLPSWAPDWSYGTKTSLGLGITGYQRFNAAPNHERIATFSKDERILFVEAAQLDKIVEVGETKEEVDMGRPFHGWLRILDSLEPVHHTGENRCEAFWRTLLTNTSKEGRYPAPDDLATGFLEWLRRKVEKHPESFQEEALQPFTADTVIQKASRPGSPTRLASEYDIQYYHALYQRLFSTYNGYLGLGSQSVNGEGKDSIWIVKGSRVPLIFRISEENKTYYKLVGGAYVHGFMHGEALQIPGLDFRLVGLI